MRFTMFRQCKYTGLMKVFGKCCQRRKKIRQYKLCLPDVVHYTTAVAVVAGGVAAVAVADADADTAAKLYLSETAFSTDKNKTVKDR